MTGNNTCGCTSNTRYQTINDEFMDNSRTTVAQGVENTSLTTFFFNKASHSYKGNQSCHKVESDREDVTHIVNDVNITFISNISLRTRNLTTRVELIARRW